MEQGYAPNLVTTGQLRLLPLAYYGDPVLTKKAKLVSEITTETRKLVEQMIETMDAGHGVGLAAPQVHHSIRLFVMRTPIEDEQNKIEWGEVEVFINPKLSMPSKETWKAVEGCLSIPSIRALVERPKKIIVEYTSLDGKVRKRLFSGWEARVIMHETDHLEGVLFIDRLEQEDRLKLRPFLQDLERRMHDGQAL